MLEISLLTEVATTASDELFRPTSSLLMEVAAAAGDELFGLTSERGNCERRRCDLLQMG